MDDEQAELAEEVARQEQEHQEQRREILRNRVRTVGRILGLFKAMRWVNLQAPLILLGKKERLSWPLLCLQNAMKYRYS